MAAGDRPVPSGYEFVRVLGAGGFGEVVLARQSALKRLVAIKRIHAYVLADEDNVRRFEREARVLAATEGQQIVRVYDLIRSNDGVDLVMEYVPGRPLSDLLDAGPLPASEAIVVLRDVASALSVAAAHGVVHRDVKPANVFVQPDGHAKLGDFGLARATADPSVFRTSNGLAMGTPAYFPPELGQQLSEPDERSDGYSFAVMAYETLTGTKPFTGKDALSLITAHWRKTPPDPATILPGFPASAAEALLRAMDRDPALRLLPLELVEELSRVKPEHWPAVTRSMPAVPTVGRSDPTVQGAAPPGGPQASVASRPPGRSRGRWLAVIAAAIVLALAATVLVLVQRVGEPESPLRITGVDVVSVPADGRGACPGTDFRFDGTISTNGRPGRLVLRWERPDGELTGVRTVDLSAGQREVTVRLEFGVTGSRPLAGSARLQVTAPSAAEGSRAIRYSCEDG